MHVHPTEVEMTIHDNSPSRDYYSAMNEDDAPPTVSNPPSEDLIVQSRPESPSFSEQHESVSDTPRNNNDSHESARPNRNTREPKYLKDYVRY